jgi:hypothetical protein
LELTTFDDPNLTEYIWEHPVGSWTHVIAAYNIDLESANEPEPDFDFYTPFHYRADFHLLMWPEPSFNVLPGISFDLDQLDPAHAEFATVREQIGSLCDLSNLDSWLDSWCKESKREGFDKLWIQQWKDVRYEWTVRGWPGLTLEHLKANLRDLEFSKAFSSSDGSLHLETCELHETTSGFESLKYKDSEFGAKLFLSEHQSNPSESLAYQAAEHLHRFGGPELVAFHFPDLEICKYCGEPPHLSGALSCESRQHTLWF